MLHYFTLPFCGPIHFINFLCAKFIFWPIWKHTFINISPLFLSLSALHGTNNNVSVTQSDFNNQQLYSNNLQNGVFHRENKLYNSKEAWALPEIWNSFLSSKKYFCKIPFFKQNTSKDIWVSFSFVL